MQDRRKEQFLLQYGSPKSHDKLVDDPNTHIQNLLKITRNGHPEHMDKLVKHRNWLVRADVAEHGQDRHRDILMHDKSVEVRREVAKHGSDVHRDHLMNDPDNEVKHAVAEHGNQHHLEHLMNDPHPFVSGHARTRFAKHFADDWLPESVVSFKQFTNPA